MNPWMWLLFVLAAAVVATIVVGLAVSVVQQVRKGSDPGRLRTHQHCRLATDDQASDWDGRDPSYR